MLSPHLRCSLTKFSKCKSFGRNWRKVSTISTNDEVNIQDEFLLALKPKDVGITEYVRSHPRPTGKFNEEPSLYHVHEVDWDGNIVQLTDLDPPDNKLKRGSRFYTHCTLFQERMTTTSAIKLISSKLNIPRRDIGYAEQKEKFAKATQRIAIPNIEAERLVELSNLLNRVKLGNFVYSPNPLAMGEYKGNNFQMLVKDVQLESSSFDETVTAVDVAMNSLKQNGFVNYFAPDRFVDRDGELGVPIHVIGKAILQRDWETVFDHILYPTRQDNEIISKAKAFWHYKRDPIEIVKSNPALKTSRSQEASLLMGLAYHYENGKGDLMRAFEFIPARIRLLYMFAFQSFVWNNIASYRIQHFGLNPVPGDFVATSTNSSNYMENEGVEVLTEEDFEDGTCSKYSIYDVLLPGPGSMIPEHPNETIHKYFEEFLTRHDLNVDVFNKDGPLNPLVGFYRHLVVRPTDVNYKIIPYSSEDTSIDFTSFIPSDFDLLYKKRYNEMGILNEETNPITSDSCKNDKMCALVDFTLPLSPSLVYATMGLREVFNVIK